MMVCTEGMYVSVSGTEPRGRAKRQLSEQARKLAVQGKWSEALAVNQQIIERTPKDVEAYNRLGKAYFELKRFRSAHEAYQAAATLDPANVIARRNLDRLEPVMDQEATEDREVHDSIVRYSIFIEEVGKTYVDDLVNVAPQAVVIEVSSGDKLDIQVAGAQVNLHRGDGEYVGQLEPRIARRLIELMELGNSYDVFVTSNNSGGVRVIIREVVRSESMGQRLSFPRQGKVAIPRAYLRDTRLFRGDEPELFLGDDDDDDVEGEDAEELEATDVEEEDEGEYVEDAAATSAGDEEDETI